MKCKCEVKAYFMGRPIMMCGALGAMDYAGVKAKPCLKEMSL